MDDGINVGGKVTGLVILVSVDCGSSEVSVALIVLVKGVSVDPCVEVVVVSGVPWLVQTVVVVLASSVCVVYVSVEVMVDTSIVEDDIMEEKVDSSVVIVSVTSSVV